VTKRSISIDFCDFHPNFRKGDNFYFNLLKERFDPILSDQPEFLIYSSHGHEHRLHSGVKIFVSGESNPPDYRDCDYSLTCRKVDDPRHLQLPFYVRYGTAASIVKKDDAPERILAGKTKFCSFVVRSHNPRKNRNRLEFFQRLSRYKKVDSGGGFMNNIGGPIPGFTAEKVHFLKNYKFNIAFENGSFPGYTRRKRFSSRWWPAACPFTGATRSSPRNSIPKAFSTTPISPMRGSADRKNHRAGPGRREIPRIPAPALFLQRRRPAIYFSRERLLDFFRADIYGRPAGKIKRAFFPGTLDYHQEALSPEITRAGRVQEADLALQSFRNATIRRACSSQLKSLSNRCRMASPRRCSSARSMAATSFIFWRNDSSNLSASR
jgi:hypothetical protein